MGPESPAQGREQSRPWQAPEVRKTEAEGALSISHSLSLKLLLGRQDSALALGRLEEKEVETG